MEYKKQIAENIIAEVELNGFQGIFLKEWEVIKKLLQDSANSSNMEVDFWDYINYISEEIGNKIRR